MSHHLDTPLARQNGRLYIDDLYVFPGQHSTVLIMDVNSTITGPDIQPGFHPEGRYEFKVHLDDADYEALTYRVSFAEAASDGRQGLRLHVLTGDEAREDGAEGTLVLDGRTGEAASQGDTRIWAGRIADSFYVDLSLLSIVLEVSRQHPVLRPGARTGVWCTTRLATDAGGWQPVNRAGHPMMWPIFWPDDTRFTYPANTRHPSADFSQDGKHVADLIAAVVAAAGTTEDPAGYGQTVARQLFPDGLPYVVGTPATYGFATRNGRKLADNAPEAMLSLVLDTAVPSGLTPAATRDQRAASFPYVVPA